GALEAPGPAPRAAPAALPVGSAAPPADPAVRLQVGVPLAWRSAEVQPTIGASLDYGTGAPYLGYLVAASAAPLRLLAPGEGPAWARPLEVAVLWSQRFFSSTPAGGEPLASREERLVADVAYPWRVGRTRVAARLGFALHRFAVEENAVLPSSTRTGPRLGAEVSHPFTSAFAAEAAVGLYPWSGPGAAERAAYGQDASGWGWQIGLGASGPLRGTRGLGWRAGYDLLHFSDSFSGPGSRGTGGSGGATYHTFTVALTYGR
ncbi:MAG TPA: hypothetical protein VFP65_29635, partial [Anaeromyxobacteraceae bacterium]|nr:hypothetical protein [Anaeromyxobacteraceae bacterium]